MSPPSAHALHPYRLAAIAAGLLLVAAAPVHGVTLSWNGFPESPGSSQVLNFACETGAFHPLVSDFAVPEAVPGFVGMDVIVDLGYEGSGPPPNPPPPPLSPFWHFEQGGCNQRGLVSSLAMPADEGGRVNPWGLDGSEAIAFMAYAPDYPSAGRGRLRLSIARSLPTTLNAGQRYFAFRLVFNTCFAADCDGCSEPGLIAVQQVILHGTNGDVYLDPWADSDWPLACFNSGLGCTITGAAAAKAETSGGASGLEGPFRPVTATPEDACGPTPARDRTWGAIKALYR